MQQFALISDLDGTLLGDEHALELFAAWVESHRTHLILVYNSGRFFDSIHELVGNTSLPQPDFVITGVGTEIWSYRPPQQWQDWPVLKGQWDRDQIEHFLRSRPELQLQPPECQSQYKVSYYVHNAQKRFLDAIQKELSTLGYDVEIIYSSARDLDILPAGVNKGTATVFLVRHLKLSPHQVIVAGDTGNDMSMFQHGFLGIVVANAHPELRRLSSPLIYQADRPYAAGVLEGVRYWTKRVAVSEQ